MQDHLGAADPGAEQPLSSQPLMPATSAPAAAQPWLGSAPPALVIRALGSFSVRGLHGSGLGETDGRMHAKALLALAASTRTGVARDEVIDALWPNHAETAARNRLYHTMHLVRRSLSALAWPGDWIVLNQGRVQLNAGIDSDAAKLDAACAGSLTLMSDDALLHILQLCLGEWAPDVDAGGLGHTLRRHLRECHVAVLREAASRQAQRGDTPARRDMLRQILQLNPTDEWAYRQCMQLDLDAARPHAVLRTFEEASRELAQQLGLKPSPALGELAWRASHLLEAADRGDEQPTPGSEPLIGREQDVRVLVSALNTEPGVWNVSGLCGVGKSALMREVARRVAPSRPDGVRIVSLGDCDDGDAVVTVLLRACGLERHEGDPQTLLLHAVRTRDMLLILDDCDATPCCQGVVDLLEDSPLTSRVVLVTRTPIAGVRMNNVTVQPLALAPAEASMEQVQLSPAVMLFQMRRVNDDLQVDADVAIREVLALVRHLDGLPLAIEWAAARTATMTPGEILRHMERLAQTAPTPADGVSAGVRPALVASSVEARNLTIAAASEGVSSGAAMERHRSVSAAWDASLQWLGDDARQACMVAAAFPGTFTERQWSQIAQGSQFHHLCPGLPLLDGLVAAGVLRCEDGVHYRMLRLARMHAKQQAQSQGHAASLELARIDQVIAAVEVGETHHESPGYTAWMNTVSSLEDEVLELLGPVQRSDDGKYLRLLLPMVLLWALRRRRHVPMACFEQGLAAAQRVGQPRVELVMRVAYANALQYVKRLDEALVQCEAAMVLVPRGVDAVAAAMAALMHCFVLNALGRRDEAQALCQTWLAETPPGSPGYLTLGTALLMCGVMAPGITPTCGEWKEAAALRARYAGSLAWREVLWAVSLYVPTLSPQTQVRIADEMQDMAVEMRTPWLTQAAHQRRAHAWLAMDRLTQASEAARAWHQLACAEGMHVSAGQACLFLAELAWREDDACNAALWLEKIPNLQPVGRDESLVLIGASIMRAVVAAAQGHRDAAVAQFLNLPRLTLLGLPWPQWELALECGALVAQAVEAPVLEASLTTWLRGMQPSSQTTPLKQRSRERCFAGFPSQPVNAHPEAASNEAHTGPLDRAAIESTASQARQALVVLHDWLRNQARSNGH
jgi:DNA-binding SARP family transcriptional activator